MNSLGPSSYRKLLAFLAELYQPTELASFGPKLVWLLGEVLPGALIAFDEIDETTGSYRVSHNLCADPREVNVAFRRLTELYRQNPFYDYIVGGGTELVDVLDLQPKHHFERTDFFQDCLRPFSLHYQTILPLKGRLTSVSVSTQRSLKSETLTWLHLASLHISLAHNQTRRTARLRALAGFDTAELASSLTVREYEVLEWLREGKRDSEIAIILGTSPRTIGKHVQHILEKTHTETRTAAAKIESRRIEQVPLAYDGVQVMIR